METAAWLSIAPGPVHRADAARHQPARRLAARPARPADGARMTAPLLCVDNLRIEAARTGDSGRRRLSFAYRARRVPGGGRRIRQRQDGGGARRARPAAARPAARTGGRILLDGEDLDDAIAEAAARACADRRSAWCSRSRWCRSTRRSASAQQMAEGLQPAPAARPGSEIRQRCLDMLERVQIRDPAHTFDAYPHEFSGGMRQRIMLASVMLLRPKLLIADEPTTALDTLTQREVLDLMVEPRARPRHLGDADHPQPRPGRPLRAARGRDAEGQGGRGRHDRADPVRAARGLYAPAVDALPRRGDRHRARCRSASR